MTTKFIPPSKPPPRVRGFLIHITIPQDIHKKFHDALDESGLSQQSFVAAMLRHCLSDLDEIKAADSALSRIAKLARGEL